MKKKLELQTIVVLLCALAIAGSWIGLQIARDSFGKWSEAHELSFTTRNLFGLGPRSELHCAGAVIGHVRTVSAGTGPDGAPQFKIVAGVGHEFAAWRFAPRGTVELGVVQSALSPSWINLDFSSAPDAIQPRKPGEGPPPVLQLEREQSQVDVAQIEGRIDHALAQLTEPQNGRSLSTIAELSEAIRHLGGVAASLNGQTAATTGTDPAKLPPIDRLLTELNDTGANLKRMTASLDTTMGKDGELDQTLANLNESLMRIGKMTDEMTKTVDRLNLRIDTTLGKMNGLLDESTATMTTLEGKADRLGDTFLGRMLIAKPGKKSTPTPPPQKSPHPAHD